MCLQLVAVGSVSAAASDYCVAVSGGGVNLAKFACNRRLYERTEWVSEKMLHCNLAKLFPIQTVIPFKKGSLTIRTRRMSWLVEDGQLDPE